MPSEISAFLALSLRYGLIGRLILSLVVLLLAQVAESKPSTLLPVVVNTWAFTGATNDAWDALTNASSKTPALDAVVKVHSPSSRPWLLSSCPTVPSCTQSVAAASFKIKVDDVESNAGLRFL